MTSKVMVSQIIMALSAKFFLVHLLSTVFDKNSNEYSHYEDANVS